MPLCEVLSLQPFCQKYAILIFSRNIDHRGLNFCVIIHEWLENKSLNVYTSKHIAVRIQIFDF